MCIRDRLSGAILTSGFYLYAAGVLFSRTFGVRDIRPAALCLSGIAIALILVLYYNTETTVAVLRFLYRNGWILISVPMPIILLKSRRRKPKCEGSV